MENKTRGKAKTQIENPLPEWANKLIENLSKEVANLRNEIYNLKNNNNDMLFKKN